MSEIPRWRYEEDPERFSEGTFTPEIKENLRQKELAKEVRLANSPDDLSPELVTEHADAIRDAERAERQALRAAGESNAASKARHMAYNHLLVPSEGTRSHPADEGGITREGLVERLDGGNAEVKSATAFKSEAAMVMAESAARNHGDTQDMIHRRETYNQGRSHADQKRTIVKTYPAKDLLGPDWRDHVEGVRWSEESRTVDRVVFADDALIRTKWKLDDNGQWVSQTCFPKNQR